MDHFQMHWNPSTCNHANALINEHTYKFFFSAK